MKPGRPLDPAAPARRAKKKAEESSLGHHRKTFTEKEVAKMFQLREEGDEDQVIAARFGISPRKLRDLIGPRVAP